MGDEATLVELPKWMFDAAQCATMRVEESSHANCEALLLLRSTIIDLLASKDREVNVKTVPIQMSESRRHR
jgi:hypothetical protein